MAPEREPRISTAMHLRIDDVAAEMRRLPQPVVRSCHIGNNTANVWGWLAYARNARLLQYDHTLYGVDTHCLPWAVLGDRGTVDASYAPDGATRHDDVGGHANDMVARMGRAHRHRMMHGVFVDHHGEDLMLRHRRIATRVARDMNGSEPGFDSLDLWRARDLIGDVVRHVAAHDALDTVFDRWVRLSRRGHVTARRLRSIDTTSAGDVTATDMDGVVTFAGHVDDLVERLHAGLHAVVTRLRTGERYTQLDYPWLALPFAYAANAITEAATDPTARHFWHAAGSASQYYVNEPRFRLEANRLFDLLEAGGFLPKSARLSMAPTFSFQLFALGTDGHDELDRLIAIWRHHLAAHRPAATRAVDQLATTTDPFALTARYTQAMPARDAARLTVALRRFNTSDDNTLPIAHAGPTPHRTFTKYGIAQHHLAGRRPRFAEDFGHLTGGEAELLVAVLGHLTTDDRS